MKRNYLLNVTLTLLFLLSGSFVMQAQEVTLNFTENTWGLPEGSANKLVEEQTFTSGDYAIKLEGAGSDGYYYNSQGYLMLGKKGASLTLPAFDFDVDKIVVTGRADASAATLMNVFVGEDAVSTQTTGSKGVNEYVIDPTYSAAGNVYILKVNSAHNAQITKIEIFKKSTGPSLTPNPSSVAFGTLVGTSVTASVEILASNLTGNITISGAVAPFSVSTETLGTEGGEVVITYSPTAAGQHTATLTISSTGADSKTVELTGDAFETVGDGSEANPFTVGDVFLLNNSLGVAEKYWVKGFITGAAKDGSGGALNQVETEDFAHATALAIAADAAEEDMTKMIPVQLPVGVRAALNLVDNPQNYKKEVMLYGTLEAYYTVTGVKNVTDYFLDGISSSVEKARVAHIYSTEGAIYFNANAGDLIRIFNVTGQQLVSRLAVDGLNVIPVNGKGLFVVQFGDVKGKVIVK